MDIGGAIQRGEFLAPVNPDGEFRINIVDKQSDSRKAAKAQRLLRQGVEEIRLELNFGYVPLRSVVALIRSAYLLMFRTFGYRYVFDVSAQAIRNKITEPLRETEVLKGISWRVDTQVVSDTALAITTAPEQFRSFVAFLKLDKNPDHLAAVALPPPGVEGVGFFRNLAEAGPQRTCSLSVLPIPNGFFPFVKLWDDVLREKATHR
jgi:hypothetical protein